MERHTLGDAELAALAKSMRRIEFFTPLTVGELDDILPFVMLCGYQPDETVFSQGSQGDAFYIVHAGQAVVRHKPGFFSRAKEVGRLGPGDFFGEMALLSSEPRNATVVCAAPTFLFVLLASDFARILGQNAALARHMEKIAAQRRFLTSH